MTGVADELRLKVHGLECAEVAALRREVVPMRAIASAPAEG